MIMLPPLIAYHLTSEEKKQLSVSENTRMWDKPAQTSLAHNTVQEISLRFVPGTESSFT